jgi:uncharacterized OsmC-like protein
VSAIAVTHIGGERYDVQIRGHVVTTDQPAPNGGDDQGPTPTELFAASLAACVAFYVGRFLRRHSTEEDRFRVECDLKMTDDEPHRVARLDLRIALPDGVADRLGPPVLRVAERCTVHNSLVQPPDVHVAVESRLALAV